MAISYTKVKKFEEDILQGLHEEGLIDRWADEGYTSKEYNDYDAYVKWIRKDYIVDMDNFYITKEKMTEKEYEEIIDSHYLEDLDVYVTLTKDS